MPSVDHRSPLDTASPRTRRLARCTALLLLAQASGCYNWVDIKPTEITKLNGSYAVATGAVSTPTGTVTTVERTVAHVERPDGTLVEIKGEYDARVATGEGEPLEFAHPVNSAIKDDILFLRGGNRGATKIPLDEVTSVQVSQYDAGGSAVIIVLVSVVGGLALGAVALSAARSSASD